MNAEWYRESFAIESLPQRDVTEVIDAIDGSSDGIERPHDVIRWRMRF